MLWRRRTGPVLGLWLGLWLTAMLAAGVPVGLALARWSAIWSGPAPGVITAAEAEELAATAGPSTVSVTARSCRGSTRGTGVVSEAGLITSAHLVEGGARIEVGGERAWSGWLTVTGYWPAIDLAAVGLGEGRAGRSDDRRLRLADQPPRPGDHVVIVARPEGRLRWQASAVGAVVAGSAYGIAGEVLLLDETVVPGWSGGPVLNRSGHVAAIVSGVDRSTGLTVAVSVSGHELSQLLSNKEQEAADC